MSFYVAKMSQTRFNVSVSILNTSCSVPLSCRFTLQILPTYERFALQILAKYIRFMVQIHLKDKIVTECLTSDIFSMLLCGVSDCIYCI